MATSLRTTNYGFGKYAPDDVTSYLTDYNGTMDKIDSAIKGVSDVATEAKTTADSNLNNIASLSQGLTATNKNVENLGKTQTAQGVEIAQLQNDVSAIEIGEQSAFRTENVKGAGNATGYLRRVGKNVAGTFAGSVNADTYNYDVALTESEYFFTIAQIPGNPLSLTPAIPSYTKLLVTDATVKLIDIVTGAIYYDAASNTTRFGIVRGTTSYTVSVVSSYTGYFA